MFRFWWWVSRGFRFGPSRVVQRQTSLARLGAMFFPSTVMANIFTSSLLKICTLQRMGQHIKILCVLDFILIQSA